MLHIWGLDRPLLPLHIHRCHPSSAGPNMRLESKNIRFSLFITGNSWSPAIEHTIKNKCSYIRNKRTASMLSSIALHFWFVSMVGPYGLEHFSPRNFLFNGKMVFRAKTVYQALVPGVHILFTYKYVPSHAVLFQPSLHSYWHRSFIITLPQHLL